MRQSLTAEFVGTYILVFAGTGAVVVNELTGDITHVGIALTFGLVVMALIYTFGHISGAHFNPAVTIGFWAMRTFPGKSVLPYIAAQVGGATAASLTLLALFGNVADLGATLPAYAPEQSFILEIILTFILMLVIAASAVHAKAIKSFAGIAIGATVGLEAMFAGPISGASMNPARSLGPALASGTLEHLWIYLTATVIGALLAVGVYRLLQD
ncbi:MIP/aquaporin family protein [Alkalicoccus luteus]|uniref:MIP family channel protein n=1 Tax=Alkalicoccus luteus TaxID=1237094 RepID=A0A969TVX2_9BACI|nr:MIP family channel protein [Alkalicoccus luteus]NJP38466.1 MIP family channel protein [Alkalicoccus luteus]